MIHQARLYTKTSEQNHNKAGNVCIA